MPVLFAREYEAWQRNCRETGMRQTIGLGLSMVDGFVKQSASPVAIYREPGLGTEIRLYFPVAVLAAPTAAKSPDLLFTDVVMPGGMGGCELAERVRGLMPDLPVLLTSGYALDALSAAARILDPPYNKATLARRLAEILPRD